MRAKRTARIVLPTSIGERSSHPTLAARCRSTGSEEFGKRSLLTVPAHQPRSSRPPQPQGAHMQVTNIVNGVDVDRLFGTIDHVNANPTLARFQFRARNQWIDGGHNRSTIKGFYGAGQEDTTRT